MSRSDPRDTVMLGSGGHARVLQAVLLQAGVKLAGFIGPTSESRLVDAVWLGGDEALASLNPASTVLVNGVGSAGDTGTRRAVWEAAEALGFDFRSVVDPRAIVNPTSSLAEGVQILAGAIVGTDARIHSDVIVNSGAIVEHHCEVHSHAHVSSGAVLGGGVHVGEGAHVGLGASVIQGRVIGDASIVGAGAAVVRDVPDRHLALGVPAQSRARALLQEDD